MNFKAMLTWEMGSGLGHLIPNLPILEQLRQQNFEVCICAPGAMSHLRGFKHLPAPFLSEAQQPVSVQRTYADILWNQAWSTEDGFRRVVKHWHDVLVAEEIGFVIGDHSPFALFAAKTLRIPSLITGTGFCCPPKGFPNFRDGMSVAESAEREAIMLNSANRLLEERLNRSDACLWSAIFSESTPVLTTFKELDHYPNRSSAKYWGAWSNRRGRRAVWSECSAKWRAFAYLKPHPHLFELFSVLLHYDVKLLAFCPSLDAQTRQRLSLRGRIQFVEGVVDVERAARDSDFTVLNAGHGTTVTSLMAGKPILHVPVYMEQAITARNTERIQAGVAVPTHAPLKYNETISQFFERLPELTTGAERFAKRYCNYDSHAQISRIVDLVAAHAANADMRRRIVTKASRPVIVVSASKKTLELALAKIALLPGVVSQRIAGSLPWNYTTTQQRQLAEQVREASRRYPDARAVVDAGSSYVRYADCLAGTFDDLLLVCIMKSDAETVRDWLLGIAQDSHGLAINHWSMDRRGFDVHPDDECFPKYDTANLVEALKLYSANYRQLVDGLVSRYPSQVVRVGSAEEAVQYIADEVVAT